MFVCVSVVPSIGHQGKYIRLRYSENNIQAKPAENIIVMRKGREEKIIESNKRFTRWLNERLERKTREETATPFSRSEEIAKRKCVSVSPNMCV